MGPVKVIITVEECLINFVYNHCRPVMSGHSNQTSYFPDSTVPYAKHSVQFKLIIDSHSGKGVSDASFSCVRASGGLLLKYFQNASVLIGLGLFLRGTLWTSVFINAYPSWSRSCAIFHCYISLKLRLNGYNIIQGT